MTTTPASQPTPPTLGDWQPLPVAGATTTPTTSSHRGTLKLTAAAATLTAIAGMYAGAGGPLRYITLSSTTRHAALYIAAGAALVLLATVLVGKISKANVARPPAGQVAVTIGALVCTGVGLNTAWMFTGTHLGITDTFTRVALCGTGEIVLIALALAARDNLKRDQAPGTPGLLVWVITALLAIPAFAEGSAQATGFWQTLVAGTWRAAFGPVGAAIQWHFAMGLEIKAIDAAARSKGALARIGRRISQAILVRFGIGDTDTTTSELLREQAHTRAANLSDRYANLTPGWQKSAYGRWILKRLRAALRTAGVAKDPSKKTSLLAELAVSSHAATLAGLDHANPWQLPQDANPEPEQVQVRDTNPVPAVPVRESHAEPEPATANPSPRTSEPTESEPARTPVREPVPNLPVATNPTANRPANLTDRATTKTNQIEQVLNLIDELGYDAVKLGLVIERTGMTKTTAYHRLNDARAEWQKRTAA